jgi:hypothetical protein
MRGWLVTFAFQLLRADSSDQGLLRDLEALSKLELATCHYGATDAPVLSFMCELHGATDAPVLPFMRELRADQRPLTGLDVLKGLNARDFRSAYIPSLHATRIAYPGYHPCTDNDEIHNDFSEQHIFESKSASEHDGAHGELKRYVQDGQLWYVLLHPARREERGEFVSLFAVGRSPHGGRLMGVFTWQVCHNLCD